DSARYAGRLRELQRAAAVLGDSVHAPVGARPIDVRLAGGARDGPRTAARREVLEAHCIFVDARDAASSGEESEEDGLRIEHAVWWGLELSGELANRPSAQRCAHDFAARARPLVQPEDARRVDRQARRAVALCRNDEGLACSANAAAAAAAVTAVTTVGRI